jgi:hypothetical protein
MWTKETECFDKAANILAKNRIEPIRLAAKEGRRTRGIIESCLSTGERTSGSCRRTKHIARRSNFDSHVDSCQVLP